MSRKENWIAAGKVVLGGAQMVSGTLSLLGHGLVARRAPLHTRMQISRYSCEKGWQRFNEGLRDLGNPFKS